MVSLCFVFAFEGRIFISENALTDIFYIPLKVTLYDIFFIFIPEHFMDRIQECLLLQVRAEALMDDVMVIVGRWVWNLCALFLFHFPKTLIFSFLLSSRCHGSKRHLTFSIFSPRRNVFLMVLLLVPLTFTHLPSSCCFESLSPQTVFIFCQLCGGSFVSEGNSV